MFWVIGRSVERDNYARESKWPTQTNARFLHHSSEATLSCEQLKIQTNNSPRKRRWSKKSRCARGTQSDDRQQALQHRHKMKARDRRKVAAQYFRRSAECPGRNDCPRSGTCDQTAVAQSCLRAP